MNCNFEPEASIDLNALHLLRLIAKYRSFTAATQEAGLSQSALTRQVQAIETKLGIKIFERTTRSVKITEPGAVLLRETEAIPNILRGALRRIQEDYLNVCREIRIGISPDLTLAHLPGIFHAQQRIQPELKIVVSSSSESELLAMVENSTVDLGILTLPKLIPSNVNITHRMLDYFSMIAASNEAPLPPESSRAQLQEWVASRTWLLPAAGSRCRELIDDWASQQNLSLKTGMELQNFDTMIQLVSMGMGAALVPRRSLRRLHKKHLLQKIPLSSVLFRELVVISPKHSKPTEHVARFVTGILFS